MWPNLRPLAYAGAILSFFTTSSLQYSALSDASLQSLTIPPGQFDIHEGGVLAPILIPRVSGTEGNKKVQQYFFDFASKNLPKWTLTTQNSSSKVPVFEDAVPFTNIILTREPPWAKKEEVSYLTLVAHFDSKYTPTGFIGATDSAAPCAMILHAAQALEKALEAKWAKMEKDGVDDLDPMAATGIQILLLDGEEAFLRWSNTDSLYGARSLAETWEREVHATGTFNNRLGSISLFVLLDLLGAKKPKIPSYFQTTNWAYQKMAEIEKRLRDSKVATSSVDEPFLYEIGKDVATHRWQGGFVEDDHIPFMARGVEILHIIANPFPRVWHTMDDNGENLDIPTVEDWARIVTAFTAEWMELDGFLKPLQTRHNDKTEL